MKFIEKNKIIFIPVFFAYSFIFTFSIFSYQLEIDFNEAIKSILFIALIFFVILVFLLKKSEKYTWILFVLLILFLFIFNLYNQLEQVVKIAVYGDSGDVLRYASGEISFPRWFLGIEILQIIYKVVSQSAFIRGLADGLSFAKSVSGIWIGIFSIWIIKNYKDKLSILLPLLSPLWFLFLIGYDEYYPFIAPLLLFSLAFFFMEGRISFSTSSKNSVIFPVFISALLPLFYLGFAPVSIFLLLYILLERKDKFLLSLGVYVLTIIFSIMVFEKGNIAGFYERLQNLMNMGEQC
ncbi:MAG: hypothetical protein PHN37_03290, partial [Candidatus Pacebacteria bacterium]|nr:hypothetical protein [Candidatus Paceibacterota bacterium]